MARAPALTEIEVYPEADRLEGFPHPREQTEFFGHEAAERTLVEAFAGGRMHHGWLVTGAAGIGKATLIYRFARHALAEPSERDPFGQSLSVAPETTAAHQVKALSHPGLLVLRRPYDIKAKRCAASIPIDEVRRVRSFLNHSAAENAWRIVIVDSADELNPNAANALLKSLEEPPKRTIFMLVSSEPGRLLPTIRSRCRRLHLESLEKKALRKAVDRVLAAAGQKAPTEADRQVLEHLAGGSVRRFLGLAGSGGLALHKKIEKLLQGLPKIDWGAAHALADELQPAAAEQKFELYFELLMDHLARLIRAAAAGSGTAPERNLAANLIGPERLATFAELWETLSRQRRDTEALNLDRKSLVLETHQRLERAARS